jgi:hypothetical protein
VIVVDQEKEEEEETVGGTKGTMVVVGKATTIAEMVADHQLWFG